MKPVIVLWLVGPVGVGKTTLINSIANFLLRVEWKDDFCFQATVGDRKRGNGGWREGRASPSHQGLDSLHLFPHSPALHLDFG